MVVIGLIFGFIQGLFWRFNLISIDNFYYDFILSWIIPLIVGIIIYSFDKNTFNKKIINVIVFILLAIIMYFITTMIFFPIRFG